MRHLGICKHEKGYSCSCLLFERPNNYVVFFIWLMFSWLLALRSHHASLFDIDQFPFVDAPGNIVHVRVY